MTDKDPIHSPAISHAGFHAHDHATCMSETMETVDAYCAAHKLRLTTARRHVLEILLREHRAMGAYEILDVLRDEGANAQPPVAYRALDFLVEHGFAHKIEKLSAFVACSDPGSEHLPAFLICRSCDTVAESPSHDATGALSQSAAASGFKIERTVMEAEGLCPNCAEDPQA